MVQPHLEPGFDEESGGVLFLDFYRYLTLMSRASDGLAAAHGLHVAARKFSDVGTGFDRQHWSRRRIRLRDGASHRV